jgi:predicted RNase H-like nuclease
MTTIVGADGCRSGWLCVFEELPSRRLGSKIFTTIDELFAAAPELEVLAIDIPIGLTDAGPRACDVAARDRLGPKRASSVFAAPIRPALHAASYAEGCDVAYRAQGKKFSKQAWAIYPKIREVDALLQRRADLRGRVYEVHPEVSFAEWNHAPIVESKKSEEGIAIRRALVSAHFGMNAYETVRARYRRSVVADDDILDAFAALRSAERIRDGVARQLPTDPATDAVGLPMRIVY